MIVSSLLPGVQYTDAFLRLGKVWVVERAAIVLLTVLVDEQV